MFYAMKLSLRKRIIITFLSISLITSMIGLFAATTLNTEYLYLNTFVEADAVFELRQQNSSDPITERVYLSPGETLRLNYFFDFTGTENVSIGITSGNGSGNTWRLKHTATNKYIPYTVKFNSGSGGLLTINNGVSKQIAKQSGSYSNILRPIEFLIADNAYFSGEYRDTITFHLTTN
ncbi:MAG: hypothetical protein ACOXZ6_04275 [Syntrophomonadaceae bacterium]